MTDPYEEIIAQKADVREWIETQEDPAEDCLMFADDFENMWGYNLGVFKQAATEVVVVACDDEWIVTDSRTISRFSRIEAEYDLEYGIPADVDEYINELNITAPSGDSDYHRFNTGDGN